MKHASLMTTMLQMKKKRIKHEKRRPTRQAAFTPTPTTKPAATPAGWSQTQ
jgi:hypothetical protein